MSSGTKLIHDIKVTSNPFLPPPWQLGDVDEFRMTLRMPPDVYENLLETVRPYITKEHTNYRPCISAEERLSLTMRYLAQGRYERKLKYIKKCPHVKGM